ncbi:MAG: hypothetical protein R3B91_20315 [Planctomycetaceae bacterium]
MLRVEENPALRELIGGTIITTDGTALLGADDKSGIAVIMTAAAHLMANRDIPCGPIRVCFTSDEERSVAASKVSTLTSWAASVRTRSTRPAAAGSTAKRSQPIRRPSSSRASTRIPLKGRE